MFITDQQKEVFLENLANGSKVYEACNASGFSYGSYYNWRHSDKPGDIAYIKRIDKALESRTELVVDSLFNQAITGNVTAIIFWLCNRGPAEWSNTHYIKGKLEHEHKGSITINHREELDRLQEEEDRIVAILNQRNSRN